MISPLLVDSKNFHVLNHLIEDRANVQIEHRIQNTNRTPGNYLNNFPIIKSPLIIEYP